MRSRSFVFVPFIMIAILAPAYALLGASLAEGRSSTWVLLAIPFLFMVSMPITWRIRNRERTALLSLYTQLTYFFMGVISFILVFTILFDAFKLITKLSPSPMYVYAFTLLALIGGSIWAATGPRKKIINLKIAGLPDALNGLRIVQISDLHIGHSIRLPYVKRTVQIANDLKPDLITLTGDIGDGNIKDYGPEIAELKKFAAPLGVFSAPGNHEYYWSLTDWQNSLARAGAVNLLNDGRLLNVRGQKVFIGGVADPAATQIGAGEPPNLEASLRGSESAVFKILLAHRPGFAADAAKLGYDLQLSGHTHGGQFFPWTIAVKFVHKPATGAHLINKMWIYVSAGTGSWGPLLRVDTTPEVTCLVLNKKNWPR
jgi:uncharacterized protein